MYLDEDLKGFELLTFKGHFAVDVIKKLEETRPCKDQLVKVLGVHGKHPLFNQVITGGIEHGEEDDHGDEIDKIKDVGVLREVEDVQAVLVCDKLAHLEYEQAHEQSIIIQGTNQIRTLKPSCTIEWPFFLAISTPFTKYLIKGMSVDDDRWLTGFRKGRSNVLPVLGSTNRVEQEITLPFRMRSHMIGTMHESSSGHLDDMQNTLEAATTKKAAHETDTEEMALKVWMSAMGANHVLYSACSLLLVDINTSGWSQLVEESSGGDQHALQMVPRGVCIIGTWLSARCEGCTRAACALTPLHPQDETNRPIWKYQESAYGNFPNRGSTAAASLTTTATVSTPDGGTIRRRHPPMQHDSSLPALSSSAPIRTRALALTHRHDLHPRSYGISPQSGPVSRAQL
ncbi:hypothetical protein FB451DRAFT_1167171 [Mycena latifolia]|nr:hypothetical protein FB451DRAFT_1167171 [Mycena latifolia]